MSFSLMGKVSIRPTPETPKLKVAIYDDSPELRCGLSSAFSINPDFEFVGAYPNAIQIVENCKYRLPDVIMMDIDMPVISGIEAVKILTEQFPDVKVLMLTVFEDNHYIFESICAGAVGYLLKKSEPQELFDAVKDAHAGGAPMSGSVACKVLRMFREYAPEQKENTELNEREKEILTCLTKGLSYKMIAAECNISIDTVRFHIKRIYEKLHVHSMTEAVSKALKNNWV